MPGALYRGDGSEHAKPRARASTGTQARQSPYQLRLLDKLLLRFGEAIGAEEVLNGSEEGGGGRRRHDVSGGGRKLAAFNFARLLAPSPTWLQNDNARLLVSFVWCTGRGEERLHRSERGRDWLMASYRRARRRPTHAQASSSAAATAPPPLFVCCGLAHAVVVNFTFNESLGWR